MPNQKHLDAIDGLLDDLTSEEIDVLKHERKRKREHAAAKLTQPEVTFSISEQDWARLLADLQRPIAESERQMQGLDYLLMTARECLRSGAKEDALFAVLRVVRRTWALTPHMPPIEA